MAGHRGKQSNILTNRNKKISVKRNSLKSSISDAENSSLSTNDPWAPSAHSALKALLSARLCAAVWNNISDCDESYNYWEPTHFLIYGTGFQTWEYSPKYAIRSYAYILIHAIPGWIYSHLLQANKVLVFYFIRCLLGFTCALCEVYFYRAVCQRFGAHIGRLTLIFLLFSSGMFIASAAFLPSSFAMYFILLAFGAWFRHNYPVVILSGAASIFLGWPFTAILGFPIVVDMLFLQKKIGVFVKWCLLSVLFILIPTCQIDTFFYGKFVFAPWNIILYNIFSSHGPNLYGVEPWHFYFINGFLNFNFVFILALGILPLMILEEKLIKLPKQKPWFLNLVVLPLYLWIVVFFTRPHKEERFLFPVYPLFCLSASMAVDSIQKLLFHVFVKKKVKHYLDSTGFVALLFVVVSSVLSLSRIVSLYRGYHAPFETYLTLGQIATETKPFHSTSNVCIGKEWYRFPSSFFLPEGWELQFIQSEFQGQLPKPYSKNRNATSIIPENMNDENIEEKSRYVDIISCHYLIDLDVARETAKEPNYSAMQDDWIVISKIPFLDAQRSHRIFRAFYIPFFSDIHCQYGNYNLLQSRHPFVKEKRTNRKTKQQKFD